MENKLISRNPILRFKLGKLIKKFQLGGTTFGRNIQYVYYTGRDGIQRLAFYNPQAKKWMYANRGLKNWLFMPENYVTWDGYNFNGDFAIVSNQKNGLPKQNSNKQIKLINQETQKYTPYNWNDLMNNSSSSFSLENNSIQPKITNPKDDSKVQKYLERLRLQGFTAKPTIKIKSTQIKTPANDVWLNGYKHNEIEDIRAMQRLLMELGLLNDKFGADGKWGKNTEAAYLKYLLLLNVPTYEKPEMPSVAEMTGIYSEENKPLYQRIRFKLGGQLVSRNPIKRFKLNKK